MDAPVGNRDAFDGDGRAQALPSQSVSRAQEIGCVDPGVGNANPAAGAARPLASGARNAALCISLPHRVSQTIRYCVPQGRLLASVNLSSPSPLAAARIQSMSS